jgi:hypothetical protein
MIAIYRPPEPQELAYKYSLYATLLLTAGVVNAGAGYYALAGVFGLFGAGCLVRAVRSWFLSRKVS